MFRAIGFVLFLVSLSLAGSPVLACPFCESEIGRKVSAGIFNADFWVNALLTLLPLAVLLLVVALIHFGFPWPKRLGARVAGSAESSSRALP